MYCATYLTEFDRVGVVDYDAIVLWGKPPSPRKG